MESHFSGSHFSVDASWRKENYPSNVLEKERSRVFFEQLCGYNFRFIQYGPSTWDVYTPDHTADPNLRNELELFPGYITEEIRVLEAFGSQPDDSQNEFGTATFKTALGVWTKEAMDENDALEHYKSMHDLIANQWVTKKDVDVLQDQLLEELRGFFDSKGDAVFCPPVPPLFIHKPTGEDMEENDDDQENRKYYGEYMHCLVTLRYEEDNGTASESPPDDIPAYSGTSCMNDKSQAFTSPQQSRRVHILSTNF
jgi:hypothetical protein